MVTEKDIISGDITAERLIRSTKMIRNCFHKIQRNNTRIVEGEIGVGQEEEGECRQVLLRRCSLSTET